MFARALGSGSARGGAAVALVAAGAAAVGFVTGNASNPKVAKMDSNSSDSVGGGSTSERMQKIYDAVKSLESTVKQQQQQQQQQQQSQGGSSQPYAPIRLANGGIDVVLGAQWGDEGKGKLVDILSQNYDVCARVAGGSNAGHTIVVDGIKYKFHLLPSGLLNEGTTGVIGNGVVIHVPTMLKEMNDLKEQGIDVSKRLKISDRAHLVFDFHQQVDFLIEGKREKQLGTTRKGIGPAYSSKILRNGIRVGDLLHFDEFKAKFTTLVQCYKDSYGDALEVDVEKELAYYESIRPVILAMTTDTIAYTNGQFTKGNRILVEGANATMLDIDFGTYPYVTSSNPSIGSVCTGLGVAPNKLCNVYGTVKAYCTRVGEGPFPTELHDDSGEYLRSNGGEFGTTTGRPRRCGWLDIPQMKYSTLVNGYTSLNLTKLDVLTGMDEVLLGVEYRLEGAKVDGMPSNLTELGKVAVHYEKFPGWKEDISKCKDYAELPENAQRYVARVEELIGVPIRWIGVGAGRDDVVDRFTAPVGDTTASATK